jgi:hypothetical protein
MQSALVFKGLNQWQASNSLRAHKQNRPIILILLNNNLPKTFNENGRREVIKITAAEREVMLKVVACFNASGVYILLFVAFKSATVKETYR